MQSKRAIWTQFESPHTRSALLLFLANINTGSASFCYQMVGSVQYLNFNQWKLFLLIPFLFLKMGIGDEFCCILPFFFHIELNLIILSSSLVRENFFTFCFDQKLPHTFFGNIIKTVLIILLSNFFCGYFLIIALMKLLHTFR